MAKEIRRAVEAAETGTSLEVAVRVMPRSDAYREATLLAAVLAGVAGLNVALFSPVTFWPVWVSPFVIGCMALGHLAAAHSARLMRLLIGRDRRRTSVERGARAAFYDEAVDTTKARTGALVYCSVWEDAIVIVPDRLLEARANPTDWADLSALATRTDRDLTDRLLNAIDALGRLGRRVAPSTTPTNELSDVPRIL